MGIQKKKAYLGMSLMAALIAADGNYTVIEDENNIDKKQKGNKPLSKPVKKIIPKGLKEFFYGENVIYALNQKNADRKAKKQGYL